MSSEQLSIEERLADQEREVAELRRECPAVRVAVPPGTNWVDAISGSMKDFPEFEKVIEYGREIRRQQLTP